MRKSTQIQCVCKRNAYDTAVSSRLVKCGKIGNKYFVRIHLEKLKGYCRIKEYQHSALAAIDAAQNGGGYRVAWCMHYNMLLYYKECSSQIKGTGDDVGAIGIFIIWRAPSPETYFIPAQNLLEMTASRDFIFNFHCRSAAKRVRRVAPRQASSSRPTTMPSAWKDQSS